MGLKYCVKCKDFRWSQEQEDLDKQVSPACRTARALSTLMNSLEQDIKFTTETVDDFCSGILPTLDYQVWTVPVLPDPVPLTAQVPTPPNPHTSTDPQVTSQVKYKIPYKI